MWQVAGKGEDQETPLAEAAYGSNVIIGMLSTLVQNWSYSVALGPGAGACVWVQCKAGVFTGMPVQSWRCNGTQVGQLGACGWCAAAAVAFAARPCRPTGPQATCA